MSGVEVSKENKENQMHYCKSCMNTVVQTFNYFHEQITNLKNEKETLQTELVSIIEEQKEQRTIMSKKIKSLEKKLAALNKKL